MSITFSTSKCAACGERDPQEIAVNPTNDSIVAVCGEPCIDLLHDQRAIVTNNDQEV